MLIMQYNTISTTPVGVARGFATSQPVLDVSRSASLYYSFACIGSASDRPAKARCHLSHHSMPVRFPSSGKSFTTISKAAFTSSVRSAEYAGVSRMFHAKRSRYPSSSSKGRQGATEILVRRSDWAKGVQVSVRCIDSSRSLMQGESVW